MSAYDVAIVVVGYTIGTAASRWLGGKFREWMDRRQAGKP